MTIIRRSGSISTPVRAFTGALILAVCAVFGCAENPPAIPPAATAANVDAALSAAQRYLDTDETEKAAAILAVLVERAPAEPRAWELFGRVLMVEAAGEADPAVAARREEAQAAYERAVTLDDAHAGLRHAAGVVAMTAGAPERAMAHFQAAVALEPDNPQYALFLAQVLLQVERVDEAERHLERVIALDPDEPIAHASLAVARLEQGDHAGARAAIATARTCAPANLGVRTQAARIYRRTGDATRGLEMLVGLPAATRARPEIAEEIALGFLAIDEPGKAANAWVHRIATGPRGDHVHAAVEAASAFAAAGDADEAQRWLDAAREIRPDDPAVIDLGRRLADG